MLREGKLVRFRCHTGHAFSADALLTSNGEELEARLWDAVRAADDEARAAHERSRPVREAAIASADLSVQNLREEAAG